MHISFMDAIAKLARSNWGNERESEIDAMKAIAKNPTDVVAWGIIELLRRLDRLSGSYQFREVMEELRMPVDAATFPDAAIGDRLFACTLEEGIHDCLIVAKDASGHCLVALTGGNLSYARKCHIAHEGSWHKTEEQAIRAACEDDIGYGKPQLDRALKAMAALDAGEDATAVMAAIAAEVV